MRIPNLDTLKTILTPFTTVAPKQEVINYLLINTDNHRLVTDLQATLVTVANPNEFIAIALIVKHIEDKFRIDSMFVVCRREELNLDFIQHITSYVGPGKWVQEGVLDFLRKQWAIAPANHALTFFWTTQIGSNCTHLSDLAIAPAYQKKGLMKAISLKLITQLASEYGESHTIQAFPIHPATYLLFNPDDKECKYYAKGLMDDKSCLALLISHGLKSKLTQMLPNEDVKSCSTKFNFWPFIPDKTDSSELADTLTDDGIVPELTRESPQSVSTSNGSYQVSS